MVERVLRAALALFLTACSAVLANEPPPQAARQAEAPPMSSVLMQLGFDEEVPTGPDTLRVLQNARGRVALNRAFPFSGFSSVELRDVPGDGDFPELQGFFPKTAEGSLLLQFALMVPDAREELNVALAGPAGFRLGRNGIALWLSTRDGWLFHTSDSIPKRLFEVDPFSWYVITVAYRAEPGRYDLWVMRQGEEEPFIQLLDQPNAASQAGSSVHLLSLIGDNGDDLSSVVYYVDDVLLVRDRPLTRKPWVAPGRRSFFTDLGSEPDAAFLRRCPLIYRLEEIGIEPSEEADFTPRDWQLLETMLAGDGPDATGHPALAPVEVFRQGCAELFTGDFAAAERLFVRGLEAAPEASALALAHGLALLGQSRWQDLNQQLAELRPLEDDPRYARLTALALAHTNDPETALQWLQGPAQEALEKGEDTPQADAWYVMLRMAGRLEEARDYALTMAKGLPAASNEASTWYLRAGRAAFTLRDLATARIAFDAAKEGAGSSPDPWLSLADVAWLEGDVEAERQLREGIYGRLTWTD